MNRTEALQAAFMIAGPNVTAEEHIQYAEFLLGEHVVRVGDYIMGEDTQSICDDPREYTPHEFIGQRVFREHWNRYPEGTVAIDSDGDVWHFSEDVWSCYDEINGELNEDYFTPREEYEAVIVA